MGVRLILIGPPGVGKGTQAAKLQQAYGVVPLSSGNIFRAEIQAGTPLGLQAKKYLDSGELVPDEVTIGMMQTRLSDPEVVESGFILDGFPRTLEQAVALDKLLDTLNLALDAAIVLEVDDEIVVDRLSGRLICPNCGEIFHRTHRPPATPGFCDKCQGQLTVRVDDNAETIRNRLRVSHEATAPILDYYERRGILIRVDGAQSPDEVFAVVTAGLGS
ncbi:MAG: adenylate kinase [Fimbriimonadaceae bacterium]|nr:MAG: adenylate kinase [Fimbriimonadaceae bacterium]